MIKKNQKPIEKILSFAGLMTIIVGCVLSLYGAYLNRGFIHDPLGAIYYFRFVILLGGGFAIGYFLSKRSDHSPQLSHIYMGVVYAVLSMALFGLIDFIRLGLQNFAGETLAPWSYHLSLVAPLLAVMATFIVAYLALCRSNHIDLSIFTKLMIITMLGFQQLFTLLSGYYYLKIGLAKYDPSSSIWHIILGFIAMPLFVVTVAYLLLGNIHKRFDRLFYAVMIGTLYGILTAALWELRMDPSLAATNIFGSIVAAVALLFAGILIWRSRQAIT